MARVRQKDTHPELQVRRALHSLGYRYRLHDKGLSGSPDIVFRPRKKVVFVHGCFWHRHEGCRRSTTPKTRADFWGEKFAANLARDRRQESELMSMGWRSFVVWECEAACPSKYLSRLVSFLDS